ncbi:hypothetical protein MTR67_040238 [Solanum verrucosum]|uniref:Uncharacterized protein n=1 Tax=Solanum verrucosum TaxID=315347 RepID=A0AAF0UI93_SOLVR|nr:hypothetical protein MTR67_040238 [Solanum verrucosum]
MGHEPHHESFKGLWEGSFTWPSTGRVHELWCPSRPVKVSMRGVMVQLWAGDLSLHSFSRFLDSEELHKCSLKHELKLYVTNLFKFELDLQVKMLLKFALGIYAICDVIDALIHVSTPIGDFVVVTQVYHACSVLIVDFQTWADLVILDMTDFVVILGITWLSPYYVVFNCNTEIMTLEIPGREKLEWEGVYKPKPPEIISFIRARKLVGEGCLAYLAHIRDVDAESPY